MKDEVSKVVEEDSIRITLKHVVAYFICWIKSLSNMFKHPIMNKTAAEVMRGNPMSETVKRIFRYFEVKESK